jgi:hypothetical protein
MPAVYPVAVYDRRGRLLARGRTANISETGVFVIVDMRRDLHVCGQVRVEIVLPATTSKPNRRDATRTLLFASRIIRMQSVGQLLGLGLEFIRKLR